MTEAIPESECLRGKVAAVTGAARGIGRATAIAFAREGADVIGLDICAPVDPRSGVEPSTPEDLEETGRLVRAAGRRWLGIKLDQRDLPALRAAAVRGEQEFGGIDILFANAGVQSFHPLLEMEDADWHITIDVNLTGTANAVRAFAPDMVKRGGGRIILTSSTQGQHGTKYGASYAQVLQDTGKRPAGSSTDEEEARKILTTKSPLGVPWIDPADVAPVVVFLASDAARMVSGATYDVTAGDSARNTA
jgi:NAD(P)-dependent dehydrogenase (short-subunit alcohol dehydrogenase family)